MHVLINHGRSVSVSIVTISLSIFLVIYSTIEITDTMTHIFSVCISYLSSLSRSVSLSLYLSFHVACPFTFSPYSSLPLAMSPLLFHPPPFLSILNPLYRLSFMIHAFRPFGGQRRLRLRLRGVPNPRSRASDAMCCRSLRGRG